jgi:hypothetical protein
MTTPAAATARTPVYPATLVDHSWLVGDGVLFCVAGSAHTTTAVAGCAYWIRDDLAAGIAPPAWAPAGRPLTFRGATYRKLPALANPADWPTVHNRLSGRGITALPASLLAAFDPAAAPDSIDPRVAAQGAASLPAHQHDCGRRILHDLHTALGDPHAEAGLLGLAGSAALDPTRLCAGTDLDLLTYPGLADETLTAAIHSRGGVYLADIGRGDPRRLAFDASRFLPARPDAANRNRLWARRRDVAWIGDVRLDLTAVPAAGRLVNHLPYAGPDLGPITTPLTVTAVEPGYPTHLTGTAPDRGELTVWVTARGYDGALRPGDRIHLSGRRRPATGGPSGGRELVTVDDWPGHHLHLEAEP